MITLRGKKKRKFPKKKLKSPILDLEKENIHIYGERGEAGQKTLFKFRVLNLDHVFVLVEKKNSLS